MLPKSPPVVFAILFSSFTNLPAAPITWGPAIDTNNKSQLAEGTVILALNAGSAGAAIVGGGASGTGNYNFAASNFTTIGFTPTGSDAGNAARVRVIDPYGVAITTTGDAGFDTLVTSLSDSFGTPSGIATGTVSLSGLTSGTSYRVQVFYNDNRTCCHGRVMRYGDGNGNTVDVAAGDPAGGTQADNYGQFATGSFTADGPSQSLTMEAVGFGNVHYTAILVVETETVPTPVLATGSSPVAAPFAVNISFSEDVTGMQESDFQVTNGAVTPSSLSGSGSTYSVEITPSAAGFVTVLLPAGVVTDLDGENNNNSVSNELMIDYLPPGVDRPTPALSTASSPVSGTFTVEVTFTEPVTGLALADFNITNGSASNLLGSGSAYTIEVTPAVEGTVSIDLSADSVTDTDGDGLQNAASNNLAVIYQLPDNPVVTIYGKTVTSAPSYEVFLTFSEAIAGLTDSDFRVVNGTASGTAAETSTDTFQTPLAGRFYRTTITAAAPGNVEVTLPAGAVVDIDGDNDTNLASNTLTTSCLADFGERWVIDDESSWTAATGGSSNLSISGGQATPTGNSATFSSTTKTFSRKHQATTLTFRQSPSWDNWTGVPNVGPSGAGDAPIFLPVANDDYYFLGRGGTGGYHAWHSTDMVNWTDYGKVTNGNAERWATTAEYMDGMFYIYFDSPNDQDPHLRRDPDLKDGILGTLMGMAFDDPSHGSDCSVIRSDEDGLFHIIYEDWSPINARANSWDSPLAGHTSSADGFTGFDPHEHLPPVDHRTTPTGTFGTYSHSSQTEDLIYEIHTPAQDAFGDWTAIKIGSRFYLFCDYDLHDAGIKVARFTSDSIYKEFDLVGSLGSGHPDPTVGFAEGQFYLITQQSTDYVSPGPWVDGVEARAGVDTDGNGTIDQWTAWQVVSESYDHKPGYARVVDVTPARLDLSGLPKGYGFKFEFRIDNTVVPGIPPVIDGVEFAFEPGNFQKWANENGTAAVPLGDHNNNGLANIFEFATGMEPVPLPLNPEDRTLSLTTSQEAMEDEYLVDVLFSDDLVHWLESASASPLGVTADGTEVNGDGDLVTDFSFASSLPRLFWRVAVSEP